MAIYAQTLQTSIVTAVLTCQNTSLLPGELIRSVHFLKQSHSHLHAAVPFPNQTRADHRGLAAMSRMLFGRGQEYCE